MFHVQPKICCFSSFLCFTGNIINRDLSLASMIVKDSRET